MPVKSWTGAGPSLNMQEIVDEFGGTAPHSLGELYAGGVNVPAGTTGNGGTGFDTVPATGTISMRHFYGTTAASAVVLTDFVTVSASTVNEDPSKSQNNDITMSETEMPLPFPGKVATFRSDWALYDGNNVENWPPEPQIDSETFDLFTNKTYIGYRRDTGDNIWEFYSLDPADLGYDMITVTDANGDPFFHAPNDSSTRTLEAATAADLCDDSEISPSAMGLCLIRRPATVSILGNFVPANYRISFLGSYILGAGNLTSYPAAAWAKRPTHGSFNDPYGQEQGCVDATVTFHAI